MCSDGRTPPQLLVALEGLGQVEINAEVGHARPAEKGRVPLLLLLLRLLADVLVSGA